MLTVFYPVLNILAPAPFLLYDFFVDRLRLYTRLDLVYFFLYAIFINDNQSPEDLVIPKPQDMDRYNYLNKKINASLIIFKLFG